MRQPCSVFGYGIALSAALFAGACQHDSNADFDDAHLPSAGSGTASSGSAGSGTDPGAAGAEDGGKSAAGGSSTAGSGTLGGKSSAGGGGTGSGGRPSGTAGKGGQATGGSAPGGTSGGGDAGKGGGETAGSGGNPLPDPDPVTIQIHELEDSTVASCDMNANFGNANTLQTDGDFCRYDALINPSLADIPVSATVNQATLSLTCVNPGGIVTVNFATTRKWTEAMVRWSNRPDVGELIQEISCEHDGDVVTIDLTDAVTAWVAGATPALGIYLRTINTDGTDFASSEAGKDSERPVLEVTYTPAKK